MLVLYPATWQNLLVLTVLFVETLGFSIYENVLSMNRDNFTCFFPNWMPFISFICLIALVMTFSTMLSGNGKIKYPCLALNLAEYLSVFHY